MKIGIIIVTYNCQKDIARLLESIIIQQYNELNLYIVDNNSKDQTLSIVREYTTRLRICIISSRTNNGFAKGNNIGIQKAMEDGCDLIFILNPDMQLEEKCLKILTERIQSDEKIGVVGPVVLLGNRPDNTIQYYGAKVNFKTQKKISLFPNKKLTNKIPSEIYVDYVLGGAMMIRSNVLKNTGLFEECYFMYNDEIDIAYRIKNAGFKSLCVRDAIVSHFHDFSPKNKKGNNLMYYYMMRNKFLYFKKFHLYKNLLLSILIEFINLPLKVLWSIRRMKNFKILKFYYSGIIDGLLNKTGISDKSFDSNSNTKVIVLTIDYELFLGEKTGPVKKCMIEPTEKLSSILKKNGSRMTVFWDILHYYRILELENNYPELKPRRLLIEEQILKLVQEGHDVQLHLHPHWLDAIYENGKWNFTYERFKLHNLSDENNPDDINTITGCISISKKLMEDLIRRVNPDYKLNAYRAGGYLVEPFDKIKKALKKNEIKIDSSVCPGLINENGIFSFDFNFYPDKSEYNFTDTPKENLEDGNFIEIPVTSIKIPAFLNFYYTIIRKIKYPHLESERVGTSTGEYFLPKSTLSLNKLYSVTHSRTNQLTTDNNFKERFSYIFKKAPQYSTMILHPKLLNSHTLKLLNEYVSTNKIRFISIQDFLADN